MRAIFYNFLSFLVFSVLITYLAGCKNGSSDIVPDDSANYEDSDTSDNDSENADQNNDDTESFDDSDKCIHITELYANGAGNESCPFQNNVDRLKREFSSGSATEEGLVLKIEEIIKRENPKVILRGECNKESKCDIIFDNYNLSLFKDSLVGKEIILYWINGFYYDIYDDYFIRDVQLARHKDGTLIAVKGVGIVNEDGESVSDAKVWPSELVPEVKVEQKILESCESLCVKYMAGPEGEMDSLHYDHLITPPLEITVNGKKPVVVRNGEVITSEGYEYFVRDSVRAAENDSDGFVFTLGKKYKFDFFIVNTEALK